MRHAFCLPHSNRQGLTIIFNDSALIVARTILTPRRAILRDGTHLCMQNDEFIFLTGATGFVGTQLVQELLRTRPGARLALLIRPRKGKSAEERANAIVPRAERERVEVISGDVSQPNCGLEPVAYDRLAAVTTRVIHWAATVRFDHSLEEARRMNVEGTRNMLDFAAAMPRSAASPMWAPPMWRASAPD